MEQWRDGLEFTVEKPKDNEIDDWAALSLILPNGDFTNRDDIWLWNLDPSSFTSRSLTKHLSSTGRNFYESIHKIIWKDLHPQRAKFFIWELNHSCLNTHDKLQRKSPNIVLSPSSCPMCQRNAESHSHLFISCPFASKIWSIIYQIFDLHPLLASTLVVSPTRKKRKFYRFRL